MNTRFFLVGAVAALLCCALGALQAQGDDGWQARSGHAMIGFQDALWLTGGLSSFEKVFFFNDVWRSENGVDWERVGMEQPYAPSRQMHALLVFQEHLYLLGGQGSSRLNDVWRSADGNAWEQVVDEAPWSARRGMACVAHDDRVFLMGGESEGGAYTNDVWASDDGAAWELLSGGTPWQRRWEHAAVSFQGKIYVIGGAGEFGAHKDVWRAADGILWEKAGELPAAVRGHRAEVFRDAIVVFGGVDGADNMLGQVWTSSDGVTWQEATATAPWPARMRHASAVHNKRLWLAGGIRGNGDGDDVWLSRDAVKWTPAAGGGGCGGCSGCGGTPAEEKLRGLLVEHLFLAALSAVVLLAFSGGLRS